jgi:hypothetical protein
MRPNNVDYVSWRTEAEGDEEDDEDLQDTEEVKLAVKDKDGWFPIGGYVEAR